MLAQRKNILVGSASCVGAVKVFYRHAARSMQIMRRSLFLSVGQAKSMCIRDCGNHLHLLATCEV